MHGADYAAEQESAQFYERVRRAHPHLRKSLRFFPTCTYAEWLKESVRACVDTIEFLQKFLREQGEPTNAPAPKKGSVGETMTSNTVLFKMAGGDTHATKLQLFRQLQAFENYTVGWGQFPTICRRCGVLPFVDMCCDVLGANSMCPYYYSVREDGTKQDYRSVPVWSNPPYKEMQEFVGPLERARQEDATTQAILVVPRTRQKDLAPIVARNRWTRADYYHKGARDFFWRPDKTSAFAGRGLSPRR